MGSNTILSEKEPGLFIGEITDLEELGQESIKWTWDTEKQQKEKKLFVKRGIWEDLYPDHLSFAMNLKLLLKKKTNKKGCNTVLDNRYLDLNKYCVRVSQVSVRREGLTWHQLSIQIKNTEG